MEWNPLKWPFYCIAGIAAIIFFFFFSFISYLHFPITYTIFTNYVSELGNPLRNPAGATYFNIGVILTGIALIPFFIGLHLWYSEVKWRTILIIISQFLGFSASFSVIMVGIFPEHLITAHLFWSYLFFILLLIFTLLISISLFTHPDFNRIISLFGFVIVGLYTLFFYLVINNLFIGLNYILEWLMVIFVFTLFGLIIFNMFKLRMQS
ncbi:MAG: DUF998 domain-containing protein [Promethearchaeota archaeon]